jgi:hypothetical protein
MLRHRVTPDTRESCAGKASEQRAFLRRVIHRQCRDFWGSELIAPPGDIEPGPPIVTADQHDRAIGSEKDSPGSRRVVGDHLQILEQI